MKNSQKSLRTKHTWWCKLLRRMQCKKGGYYFCYCKRLKLVEFNERLDYEQLEQIYSDKKEE